MHDDVQLLRWPGWGKGEVRPEQWRSYFNRLHRRVVALPRCAVSPRSSPFFMVLGVIAMSLKFDSGVWNLLSVVCFSQAVVRFL